MSSAPWYAFYPGDYSRDTAHLTLLEHGAYRLLLDHYYSTSSPIPADKKCAYRICRASLAAERAAVDRVLKEFFRPGPDGYRNARADAELTKRTARSAERAESGRRGALNRWGKDRSDSLSALSSNDSSAMNSDMAQPSPGDGSAIAPEMAQPLAEPMAEPIANGWHATATATPTTKTRESQLPQHAFASDLLTVTTSQDAKLADVFPWVDRAAEYRKMGLWLEANRPGRKVLKVLAFTSNWFGKIPNPAARKPTPLRNAINSGDPIRRNPNKSGVLHLE